MQIDLLPWPVFEIESSVYEVSRNIKKPGSDSNPWKQNLKERKREEKAKDTFVAQNKLPPKDMFSISFVHIAPP